MASAPLDTIDRAHQMYRDGRYRDALGCYTEALVLARTKTHRIAIHSNRAACYLKLHDFKKAAEECSSVLELDQKHTGALMLRAQTLVTLKEYHAALFDVNLLLELDPLSEVYQNLHARLKTQLSLAPIPECDAKQEEEDEEDEDEVDEENIGVEEDEKVVEISDMKKEKTDSTEIQNIDSASSGWQAIPKPKGHSNLDYSQWDKVVGDSSDEDEDDDDSVDDDDDDDFEPQYRFRVKTVDVRPVK